MSIAGLRCRESALQFGCDRSTVYNRVDADFFNANRSILTHERGAGYWLWKPYIICRELQKLNDGDILVYSDASILFIDSIDLLLRELNQQIMLFSGKWNHKEWCKMDTLVAMGCDKISTDKQLNAGFIILKKTDFSLTFCKKWLEWCQMPRLIDDSPSKQPNIDGFREHRHDQAILTNLAYLHGLTFNWWPCQNNLENKALFPHNSYPAIFRHVRRKNLDYRVPFYLYHKVAATIRNLVTRTSLRPELDR